MTAPPAPATARYRGHPLRRRRRAGRLAAHGARRGRAAARLRDPDHAGRVLFLVVDVVVGLVYGVVAAVILSRRGHPAAWLVSLTAVGGARGARWRLGRAPRRPTRARRAVPNFGPAVRQRLGARHGRAVPRRAVARETPLTTVAWAGRRRGRRDARAVGPAGPLPMVDTGWPPALVAVVGLGDRGRRAVAVPARPVAERPGLLLLAAGTALMALVRTRARAVHVLRRRAPGPDLPPGVPGALPGRPARHDAAQPALGIDLAVSRTAPFGLLTLGLLVVYAGARLVGLAGGRASRRRRWRRSASCSPSTRCAAGSTQRVRLLRPDGERRGPRCSSGPRCPVAARPSCSTGSPRRWGEALRLESVTLRLAGAPGAPRGTGPRGTGVLRRARRWNGRSPQGQGPQPDVVGTLSLTPRPGERLGRAQPQALDRLEPVLAAGLGLVRATDEVVRASATRPPGRGSPSGQAGARAARWALGPWMSGLRLGLQGARNVLRTDPEAADARSPPCRTRWPGGWGRTCGGLLAQPAAADPRGARLGAALADLAARHAAGGFGVELVGLPVEEPGALAGLDPRVAAVAYAVASEAVLNAARHSGVRGGVLDVRIVEGGGGRSCRWRWRLGSVARRHLSRRRVRAFAGRGRRGRHALDAGADERLPAGRSRSRRVRQGAGRSCRRRCRSTWRWRHERGAGHDRRRPPRLPDRDGDAARLA